MTAGDFNDFKFGASYSFVKENQVLEPCDLPARLAEEPPKKPTYPKEHKLKKYTSLCCIAHKKQKRSQRLGNKQEDAIWANVVAHS